MIRFGALASVVAVAIGLLVVGAVSGDLVLVYVSIGLAALALLMLFVGVIVWRDQVFGPVAGDSRVAGQRAGGAAAQLAEGAAHPGVGWPAEQVASGRAGRQPASGRPQEWHDREPAGIRDRVPAREPAPGREPAAGRGQAWPGREPMPAPGARSSRGPAQSREPAAADRTVVERQIPAERAGRPSPGTRPAAAEHATAGDRLSPSPRPVAEHVSPAERVTAVERPAAPERAAAERPQPPEPARAEPVPAAPSQAAASPDSSADDPTRLARRLHSAAELSRHVVPDTTRTVRPAPSGPSRPGPDGREPSSAGAGESPPGPSRTTPFQTAQSSADHPSGASPAGRRFADPLTGPPLAASSGSGRTRLQKDAEAAATAKFAAGSAGSSGQARSSAAASPDAATRLAAVPASRAADGSAAQAAEAERGRPSAGAGPASSDRGAADSPATHADAGSSATSEDDSPAGGGSVASAADAAASGADGASTNGRAGAAPGAGSAATTGAEEVSVVPGIARYHKSGCILIRFLGDDDLEMMTRAAAEESGCVPCRACRPEKTDA